MSILKFLLGHLSTAATVRPTRMQHPKLFENRTPRSTEREVLSNFSFFLCLLGVDDRSTQSRGRSVGGGVADLSLVGDYCYRNLLALADNCL